MMRTAEQVWSVREHAYVSVAEELLRSNNESALLAQRKLFDLLSTGMPDSTQAPISLLKQFWPDPVAVMLELLPRFETMWAFTYLDLSLMRHLEYWRMNAKFRIVLDFPTHCLTAAGLNFYELGDANPLKLQHVTSEHFEIQAEVYDMSIGMLFSRMLTFLYYYEMFAPAIATEAAYAMPDYLEPDDVRELLAVFNDVLDTLVAYEV
jgi:hypothetical protein